MLSELLLLAAPALLTNARLETQALTGPLERAVRQAAPGTEPAWVGWSAPRSGGDSACCVDIGHGQHIEGGGCRLESDGRFNRGDDRRSSAPRLQVLLRVMGGRVERVRTFTEDCALDAGGRRVLWLDGVAAPESVGLLVGLLFDPGRSGRIDNEALAALGLHDAREALAALLDLAKRHPSGDVRGGALFWLAQRAGSEARAAITRAIEEDPETEVKRRAVFALSELNGGEGVPLLIDLARHHKNPAVREQAFFWLGESEDPRALAFFEEVLGR